MITRKIELASQVKAWRGDLPVRVAADLLGLPKRTLDGIEQGRPFRYEQLLLAAMKAINPNEARQ
jgi:hypothetical protein